MAAQLTRARRLLHLNPEKLLRRAQQKVGLSDLGYEFSHEGFDILHEAYETEARLSLTGRLMTRHQSVRLLCHRLRIEEALKRNPGVATLPVTRPVFITGLPRSGTTLLHRLLAQDPAHRAPLSWELFYPVPAPTREWIMGDTRIAKVDIMLRGFNRITPDLRIAHEVGTRLPEECITIFNHTFLSFVFTFSHHVPSYRAWLERQDLTPAYAFHRFFQQYLQSGWTAERWVLKAPAHLFGLSALLAVYPDAHIIQTHRDPLAVAPSFASFTVAMRRALSSVVEPVAVAREQAQLWARAVDHAIRFRDSEPRSSAQFCDVAYRDLIDDPMGTVRRIYGQFHLPLTETAQSAMRHFLMRDGSRRRTPHAYALEEFGLNRREEERRYAFYCQRFDVAPEIAR